MAEQTTAIRRRTPFRVWAFVVLLLIAWGLTFATGHPGWVLAVLPLGLAIPTPRNGSKE